MIFEIPYWKDRLHAAKTQEDFSQLLQDLPDNPTNLSNKPYQLLSVKENHIKFKGLNVDAWDFKLNFDSTHKEFSKQLDGKHNPETYEINHIIKSRRVWAFLQISAVFLFLISNPVFAGWFSPSNYSECVEKYVKPSKSQRAAAILNHTCRQQFTEKIQSSDWEKYYSCVRNNLKNVEIDNSASLLLRSCKEKYQELFFITDDGSYLPMYTPSQLN